MRSARGYGAAAYEWFTLFLLLVQYFLVNIVFTTYTQNIVIFKDLAAPFFSLLVLGLWIAGDLLTRGAWRLPRSGMVAPMVVALLAWTAFALVSPASADAIELVGRMAGYFIMAWALMRFVDSPLRLRAVFVTIALTNFVMIAYGFGQLQGWDALVELNLIPDWGMMVFVSTHGNQIFFASILVTTLPILVGWMIVTISRAVRAGLACLVVLNLYCILSSIHAPSWLAVEIALPLLILLLLPTMIRGRRRWLEWILPTLLALVIGAAIVGIEESRTPSWSRTTVERIMTMNEEFGGLFGLSCGDRTVTRYKVPPIFWRMALDGALIDPWLGRGLASFNYRMPETRTPDYHRQGISHNTDHSFNEHLEWLHDTGLVGLALFWWILAAFAVAGWRLIRSLRGGSLHPLAIAAFLGPWCFWFTSSFYVSSRWTGPNTNLWFVVGLFLALGNFVGRQERERSVESGATVGAILESSLQDGRIGVDCVGAIHTAEEATSCRPATPLPSWQGELPLPITPDQSDAETDSAPVLLTPPHHISPAAISGALTALLATTLIAGGYLIFAARSWMADHALRNNMMHTECDGGDIRQAVEEAERARDLRPSDPSIYYKLAYSYLVDSRPHVALDGYRTLQSIAPNYAQLHINLAYLNDQLGYRATALFERDRAAAIEHNVRNHRDAAQNWLSFGSPGRAVAHLRHALTVDVDRTMQRIGWIRWHQHDEILVDLARLHLAQGETRQALVSLERSLRLNPDNQAAGLLLAGIEAPPDLRDAVARMMANLAARSLNNPALIIEALEKAMAERRFAEALALAAQAVEGLSLPPLGDQLDQDAVEFGNAILKNLQALFAAEVERPRCFALAGWIFACQGRYAEAENFLEQAYATLRDPRIAEQLGQVKARVAN